MLNMDSDPCDLALKQLCVRCVTFSSDWLIGSFSGRPDLLFLFMFGL